MAESHVRSSGIVEPAAERTDGGDLVINLQSQLKSLRYKVEVLELENARLSSLIATCRCCKVAKQSFWMPWGRKSWPLNTAENQRLADETEQPVSGLTTDGSALSMDASFDSRRDLNPSSDLCSLDFVRDGSVDGRINDIGQSDESGLFNGVFDKKPTKCAKKKSRERMLGCDQKTMAHNAKRFVALKIMYFGQRFYGFASEAQMDPTVESEIFKAFEKTKLLVSDKKDVRYSRCGRTDKGVSATDQVIALFLRSNLKDTGGLQNNEESTSNLILEEEIDYVKILNRVLPKDIRVIGWCPAPADLHARFSCSSRQYKYFFWREKLDILAMEIASKKFVGEHDFRNFCKMDAANVHNYRRLITSFKISSCSESVWLDILKHFMSLQKRKNSVLGASSITEL